MPTPAETTAPPCAGPLAATSRPQQPLPALSCDSHLHILGPADRYPYAADRIYTPPDCLLPAYLTVQQALGLQRWVLVQPSVYGTDNRVLLDALAQGGNRARGVAVVADDAGASELRAMAALGVRGVRVNLVDVKGPRQGIPADRLKRLADRIGPLGWHLELLAHVDAHPDLYEVLRGLGVQLVFGHMGYLSRGAAVGCPGMDAMVALMREGRAWAKLTAPYRLDDGPRYAQAAAAARTLVAACPERLVWGTDWPHVMVPASRMPDDGRLVDLALDWMGEAAVRQAILVDNPASLYGW